jgi:hypothetical protein
MAKYKFILLCAILLCTITTFAQPAQYTPMTAAGYQMKRLKVDSTLHLPSFCGVPTIRGSVAKEGALAIDTCGRFLYMWTRAAGWDTVNTSGGGGGSSTDTTSLSNRINKKIDSLKRSNDSVYAWINGSRVFQFKDSVGSGGGDFWKTSGTTVLSGADTIVSDNGTLIFVGGSEDMARFSVQANNIDISTSGGDLKFIGLDAINDTTNYKPLVINSSTGAIEQSTSWVGGGSGSADTIYTQNPIMFINRNDSNIIFFNADTANVWRNTTSGIDSLKRSSDSVYARKNGNFIFQFKDSVGGAGSDTAKVVIAQVHNATATTLLKGEVVYLFGATGNVASVKRANNKTDATSSKTFGLVRRDIPAGGTGFITTQGQLEKLNLGSYAEGDVLWLDSIDGQFTKVKPQAPYHGVFLGIVERANNGNGLAYIKPQNGVELDEIHDVQINNLVNNQIIVYSDTQQVWKNRNISTLIDTSAFQRKSIQPYSFLANNTPATANAQALPFKDTSGTYTGTITWGTSAPTGATNHTYRWTRIGNMVTLNISLVYGTVSSGNTQVTIALPADAPTPVKPTGLNSASAFLYPATCVGGSTITASASVANNRGGLKNNSGNNNFEINMAWTSAATFIYFETTVIYYTN